MHNHSQNNQTSYYIQKRFTILHNRKMLQKVVKRSYIITMCRKGFTTAKDVHNCRLCSKCHNVIAMCRKYSQLQTMFTTAESSQMFIYYNYVQKRFTTAENVHNCRLCSKCHNVIATCRKCSQLQKMFTTAESSQTFI